MHMGHFIQKSKNPFGISIGLCFAAALFAGSSEAKLPCPNLLGLRAEYDQQEGLEHLETLKRVNREMERLLSEGKLTLASLYDPALFGSPLLVDSNAPVLDNSGNQTVPYRQIDLPFAFTGFYLPTGKKQRALDLSLFDAALIALPGIGAEVSVARTLFEITGTFNKGGNEALSRGYGKPKLRVFSIALDAPLNGLASHAPYSFGHPDAVMEVMRHVDLIMSVLAPGKLKFWIGRSQGGINVLEYASRYQIAGAIALNPSSPDEEILERTIVEHENMTLPDNSEKAVKAGFSVNFHKRSWSAHHDYTPLYRMGNTPSLSPCLVLFGDKDWGYPQELYKPYWQTWGAAQANLRALRYYPGKHDLWMRPSGEGEALFASVVRDMADFMNHQLPFK